jgi:hypothetical protein
MTTNNELNEQCMECSGILTVKTYAIYKPKSKSNKKNDIEEIAGYLCEKCRSKHKIKPMRNINELEKLLKLIDR